MQVYDKKQRVPVGEPDDSGFLWNVILIGWWFWSVVMCTKKKICLFNQIFRYDFDGQKLVYFDIDRN
jgi:hypothetical protein